MDALQRVTQIGHVIPSCAWTREDFVRAAVEGKRRWRLTEDHLHIEYGIFQDAVALIAPDYHLTGVEESAILAADVPEMRNVSKRIAVYFVK
jgi:hypothetical protein